MNPKIVKTIRVLVTPSFYDDQLTEVRKAINVAVTGQENCNKFDENMQLVPANPMDIDKRLQEAHHNIKVGRSVMLEIDFTEDGQQVNQRVVK